MTRILVAGESLIDFIPDASGPLASVDSFDKRAGGAPANVAVGLARLDTDLDFWTRVGDDAFGDFLVETLADEGLAGDLVEQDPDAQTTLAFVSLGEDADREFSFYHDGTADTRMKPGTIDDDALAAYGWVHVDVLSLDTEPSRAAIIDLAERAQGTDTVVSFDPNSRPERWGEFSYLEAAKQGFRLADVVKATPEDLREAGFEGDASELARELCAFGPHTALITLGDEGSYAYATADAPWVDEETEVTHDGYTVDPVDTTGAGDAFTAGMIAALSSGESLAESLAFGNAVAATTTTAAGAMTALPTRADVQAFRE
ncbi:carbohydrate kinase family protein [Halogranum rubrum]|uniref:Sugar kinase n=1 Tax=Halogranum salarium B-1 TaxID=1210908 RepID=J2ZHA9_9EURY|nr:carbohydrate kinase [Halogranum salarium]EJN60095.1 sugar kinase [Halogranum salarium B-1]